MADDLSNSLPPEYMAEIDAANKKRMLAQLLQKQAFGFQGAPTGGRVSAKTSPLAWLANAATGYLGASADSAGASNVRNIQSRALADQKAEGAALLAAPEDQQLSMAQAGKFPQTQALGKLLYDRKMKQLEGFSSSIRDVDPGAAANANLTGKLPTGPYSVPPIPSEESQLDAQGNPYLVTTNRKGERAVRYAPKGQQITNVMPGQESKFSLDALEAELKPRQAGADAAKNTYIATTRAVDALQRGAKAGGGEVVKQWLRKAGQAFGVNMPDTAPTEELSMALGNAILTEAAKIKPISNNDIDTLKSIVGSINTDPMALTRALAFSQALSLRGLSEYSRFVDEQGQTLSSDVARQRLAGSKVGYEMPKQLAGTPNFQMEVLRNYKLGGGDVSIFGEPGTGKPMANNTEFDTQPTMGMPGAIPEIKPAGVPPPANGRAYTLEEFRKYFPGTKGP